MKRTVFEAELSQGETRHLMDVFVIIDNEDLPCIDVHRRMLLYAEVSVPNSLTFQNLLLQVEDRILADFDLEIAQKQLVYHNRYHVNAVRSRAGRLFEAIAPQLDLSQEALRRMRGILDLCAMAHDAVQIFAAESQPDAGRRRDPGVSEAATFERLASHIRDLQETLPAAGDGRFTENEVQAIREAIEATVVHYDSSEKMIYQPALHQVSPPRFVIAHLLALADFGSLGLEGIESFNEEGRLLFLEENPDATGKADDDLRRRLLERARFQVRFARSRLEHLERELVGLPVAALPAVREAFSHLTEETVHTIEATTPTNYEATLPQLLTFFRLGVA